MAPWLGSQSLNLQEQPNPWASECWCAKPLQHPAVYETQAYKAVVLTSLMYECDLEYPTENTLCNWNCFSCTA